MLSLSEIEYINDCLSMYAETNKNKLYFRRRSNISSHFQLSYCCCKKVYFVQRGKGKGFFLKKLSCSSGFTRRREQIRPESPLSNQGFNLFQSPQISTPCQLEHRVSLIKFEKYNSRATTTIWYLWFCTSRPQDFIFLLFHSHFNLFHEDK